MGNPKLFQAVHQHDGWVQDVVFLADDQWPKVTVFPNVMNTVAFPVGNKYGAIEMTKRNVDRYEITALGSAMVFK